MTIVFQIAAILAIIVLLALSFRGGGARQQALRRVFMVFFIGVAAVALIFPQTLTWVANQLGIGRGADLLLYMLVLVFLAFVASSYRRFRHLENDTTRLARRMALDAARAPGDDRVSSSAQE